MFVLNMKMLLKYIWLYDCEQFICEGSGNLITGTWLQLPGAAHKSTTRFTPAKKNEIETISNRVEQNASKNLSLFMRH